MPQNPLNRVNDLHGSIFRPRPRRSRARVLKNYHVTVGGLNFMVKAGSVYFAALVYGAMANCAGENQLPVLLDSTELRIRAVGDRRVRRILWWHVLDWANREAKLAFDGAESAPKQFGS
jgi:hypothetical protein